MSVPFIAYARRDKLSITGCRRKRRRKRRRITIRRTDNKGKTDRRGDGRKQGCAEIRQRISRSGEREGRGVGRCDDGAVIGSSRIVHSLEARGDGQLARI